MERKSVLVDDMSVCLVCGAPHPHVHHVYFNAKKKFSEKYGYLLPLCYWHHEGNTGPHLNREVDLMYKRMAQMHYEAHHGTREDFIREVGKSYLTD